MSDLSVLRWRIDQQSQLIMRLKIQLDESISKLKVQEKMHEDTCKVNELVNGQIQDGEKKILEMENETSNLSATYKELVKLRDNLKEETLALQEVISRTAAEGKDSITTIIEQKTQQVQEKNKLIASAQVQLSQLDTEYNQLGISNEADILQQEKDLLETIHVRTKAELQKMTEDVEAELDVTVAKLQDIKNQREMLLKQRNGKIEKFENENEELVLSIEEKTKQLEEERFQRSQLEKKEAKVKEELTSVEQKFKSEKYLIYPDLLIEKLTADLNHIQSENKKALKEFSAYQKHTEYLIKREQLLNRRFQMLSHGDDEEEK